MLVDVNLLPEKEKQDVTWLIITAVLLALFLLAYFLLRTVQANEETQVDALQKEQEELAVMFSQDQTQEDDLDTYINAVTELEDNMLPVSSLLHHLIRHIPDGTVITGFDYSNPENLQLSVRVEEIKQAALLQHALLEDDAFFDVTMETMTYSDPLEDDFHLEGRVPRYDAIFELTVSGDALRRVGEEE